MYSAQSQFESSKSWRTWNWILGGSTAAASGVAGVLTFATDSLQSLSGILALLAALVAAVHATLKPNKKAEHAQISANEYAAIQAAARRFLNVDIDTGELQDLRQTLESLADRAESANRSADVIPRFAYRRAKKNIQRGGQDYAVDTQ